MVHFPRTCLSHTHVHDHAKTERKGQVLVIHCFKVHVFERHIEVLHTRERVHGYHNKVVDVYKLSPFFKVDPSESIGSKGALSPDFALIMTLGLSASPYLLILVCFTKLLQHLLPSSADIK